MTDKHVEALRKKIAKVLRENIWQTAETQAQAIVEALALPSPAFDPSNIARLKLERADPSTPQRRAEQIDMELDALASPEGGKRCTHGTRLTLRCKYCEGEEIPSPEGEGEDLIARLRSNHMEYSGGFGREKRPTRLELEAADAIEALLRALSTSRAEIEALREALKIATDDKISFLDQIEAVVKERDEMREALKSALEIYAGSEGFLSETAAEEYQKRIIEQMVVEIQKGLKI